MIRYVLACIRNTHNRNGHRTPIQTTTEWLLTKCKFLQRVKDEKGGFRCLIHGGWFNRMPSLA